MKYVPISEIAFSDPIRRPKALRLAQTRVCSGRGFGPFCALHSHACVVCAGERDVYFDNHPAESSPARWEARYPPLKRGFHPLYSPDGASAAGGEKGNRKCCFGNAHLRSALHFASHSRAAWCALTNIGSRSWHFYKSLACPEYPGGRRSKTTTTGVVWM